MKYRGMAMATDERNTKKVMATLAVLVLVAIMVLGVNALSGNKFAPENATSGASSDVPAGPRTATADAASAYQDGQYTATGQYTSPGGQQSVTVNLTLEGGKVVAATVDSGAKDPTSEQFQAGFIKGYKDQVVGKDVDGLQLSKISGSSLTPQGFNDAVEQIKTQAASQS